MHGAHVSLPRGLSWPRFLRLDLDLHPNPPLLPYFFHCIYQPLNILKYWFTVFMVSLFLPNCMFREGRVSVCFATRMPSALMRASPPSALEDYLSRSSRMHGDKGKRRGFSLLRSRALLLTVNKYASCFNKTDSPKCENSHVVPCDLLTGLPVHPFFLPLGIPNSL